MIQNDLYSPFGNKKMDWNNIWDQKSPESSAWLVEPQPPVHGHRRSLPRRLAQSRRKSLPHGFVYIPSIIYIRIYIYIYPVWGVVIYPVCIVYIPSIYGMFKYFYTHIYPFMRFHEGYFYVFHMIPEDFWDISPTPCRWSRGAERFKVVRSLPKLETMASTSGAKRDAFGYPFIMELIYIYIYMVFITTIYC